MKLLHFVFLFILFVSCRGTKISDHLCSEWVYLKYPIVRKGYIGEDSSVQGEICFQRKWKSYIGLSQDCMITLLGEPARKEKNVFIYYFGIAERDMAVGAIRFYFRGGKMKKIHCSLI